MEWVKVGDKNPENGERVLLFHFFRDGCHSISIGNYNRTDDMFIERGSYLPVAPSHWCSINLPPGDDE